MIVFIPSSVAETLSEALWRLANPYASTTATKAMFGTVSDTNGGQWMQVLTEYTITVHPEAELNGIAAILQPWIDAGHLPADTNTTLTAFVESKRGQALTIYDAFPPLFKSMAKTREQMEAEGLLTPPPTP
jgi:hypothetical protein